MGISLPELAIKGTATAVTNKIRAVKDAKKLRIMYMKYLDNRNRQARINNVIEVKKYIFV